MQSIPRFMAAEAKELRPGGEMVITRFADILVIQAIRSWIAQDPSAQTGWLGALQDKQGGARDRAHPSHPCVRLDRRIARTEVAMLRSAFDAAQPGGS